MSFESLTNVANDERTGYSNRGPGYPDQMTIAIHDPQKHNKTYRLLIKIPVTILNDVRYVHGDKVNILVDPIDRTGLITRTNSGRWQISITSGKNSGTIYLTMYESMPFVLKKIPAEPVEKVSIRQEGILFIFPNSVEFKI